MSHSQDHFTGKTRSEAEHSSGPQEIAKPLSKKPDWKQNLAYVRFTMTVYVLTAHLYFVLSSSMLAVNRKAKKPNCLPLPTTSFPFAELAVQK